MDQVLQLWRVSTLTQHIGDSKTWNENDTFSHLVQTMIAVGSRGEMEGAGEVDAMSSRR
jgi:hypothetical protein